MRLSSPSFLAAGLTAGLALATPGLAADIHVPADAPNLSRAIQLAQPGDTVIVADGVWSGNANRDLDFGGKDIVVRSANGAAHCIIDCEADYSDPHRAFLFQSGETRAAVVQGFTIRRGSTEQGAIADQFNGGGILIRASSPQILDCVFENNLAGCWGGAVYASDHARPLIARSMFIGNHADDDGGGFFAWNQAEPVIVRSVFIDNSARVTGGAITAFDTTLMLQNITVVGNEAPHGAGLLIYQGTTLRDSIVWDNLGDLDQIQGSGAVVENSIVMGGFVGPGNRDVDPLLAADRMHLRAASPAVGTGLGTPLALRHTDFEGEPILAGVDLGADELTPRAKDGSVFTPPPSNGR